jgi:[ribosomal protein S5]-alanine N-acetyltransferase
MIKTTRLQLLPVERLHKKAFSSSRSKLAELLNVVVPENWPQFPEAFSVSDDEAPEPATNWNGYFFIQSKDRALIGNGGFVGEPDKAGVVEIGYEIATEYWNRGFATEAAKGMIDYAFIHEEVKAVIAHTLAEKNASNNVLQKVGMTFIAELANPEVGKIWRWQITKDDYRNSRATKIVKKSCILLASA